MSRRSSDFVPLGGAEPLPRARWLAPVSVAGGSLLTLLPVIATVPLLPPFGLMFLLGWRLHRANTLPLWSAAAFGLFDDLVSGQPLGSATLTWALCFLLIAVLDTRLMWRDFWQNWLVGSGSITACLILGRLFATPLGAHVDTVLLWQILVSALIFPGIYQLCLRWDRDYHAP